MLLRVFAFLPDGDICPAVEQAVQLFLSGPPDDYISNMGRYVSNPVVLANEAALKKCVDSKLTEEDKQHAVSAVVSPVRLAWPGDSSPKARKMEDLLTQEAEDVGASQGDPLQPQSSVWPLPVAVPMAVPPPHPTTTLPPYSAPPSHT